MGNAVKSFEAVRSDVDWVSQRDLESLFVQYQKITKSKKKPRGYQLEARGLLLAIYKPFLAQWKKKRNKPDYFFDKWGLDIFQDQTDLEWAWVVEKVGIKGNGKQGNFLAIPKNSITQPTMVLKNGQMVDVYIDAKRTPKKFTMERMSVAEAIGAKEKHFALLLVDLRSGIDEIRVHLDVLKKARGFIGGKSEGFQPSERDFHRLLLLQMGKINDELKMHTITKNQLANTMAKVEIFLNPYSE